MAEALVTGLPVAATSSQSTFSYAQAAKSQTLPQAGTSETITPPAATPSEEKATVDAAISDMDSTARYPNEDDIVKNRLNGRTSDDFRDDEKPLPSDSAAEHAIVDVPSQTGQSADMIHALKEDDIFSSSNEAEASWDKLSQHSQVERSSSKTDGDTDDSKLSTWEHVDAPQFKEAPLPAVNIWQKRAQDLEAKALETKSVHHTTKVQKGANHETLSQTPKIKAENSSSATRNGSGSSKNANSQSTQKVSRTPENQKVSESMGPPPPPNDAMSWPTPSVAKEEEKKKGHDRADRSDNDKTPSRPHGRDKWEKVDYVPTAVFSTPLPPGRRGGRMGGRGAREGGTRGGHAPTNGTGGADRPESGPTSNAPSSNATPPNERVRRDNKATVRGSTENGPRRSASTGPQNTRDKPRGIDGSNDKPEDIGTRQFPARPSRDNRRVSVSTQPDVSRTGPPHGSESFRGSSFLSDQAPITAGEHASSRPSSDRRGDPFFRPREYPQETNGYVTRERREGRAERGRGNWRFKASQIHSNVASNGNQPPNGQPFGSTKFAYHQEQRHSSQPYVPPFGNGREPRHHRTNSRSHSIPNAQGYGRFMNGGMLPAAHHLPPLQTSIANMYPYQPEHSGAMSAMPFNPYMERNQLHGILQLQLEYYFSVDNLLKDMFLRERMDSQGFVFLHVLSNFNRMKQLKEGMKIENEVIRFACYESRILELVTGHDGVDRVRKAEGWEQWVLKIEDRDPSAQNEGPAQLQSPTFVHPPNMPIYAPFDYARPPAPGGPMSAREPSSWNGRAFEPMSAGSYPPTGHSDETQPTQTPLSANVPDFKPSGSTSIPHSDPLGDHMDLGGAYANHTADGSKSLIHQPNIFRSANSPTHEGSGRANGTNSFTPQPNTMSNAGLSNGSLEQEHVGTTGETKVSGSSPQDYGLKADSRSPESTTEPLHASSVLRIDNPLALLSWHQQVNQCSDESLESITPETFSSFRKKALQSRERASIQICPPDMTTLYHFWATYLFQNFNTAMYGEFRRLALADSSERDSHIGLGHLIDFYYEWLIGPNTIPNRLARDFVDIAREASGKLSNSAFHALRAAWQSDALHCKNRAKVQSLLDEKLQASLESLK